MHRSRVGIVLIDHPAEAYDAAADFWHAARGGDRRGDEPPYESLDNLPGGVQLALQRTGSGTPSRVHLDIETDDVDAEVERVLALGASVLQRHEEHVVLTDPGGLVFCVVPTQTGEAFEQHATTWP